MKPSFKLRSFLAGSVLFAMIGAAHGQTWDNGGGTSSWGLNTNWSLDTLPAFSGSTTDIIFDGTAAGESFLATGRAVRSITFTSAATTTATVRTTTTLAGTTAANLTFGSVTQAGSITFESGSAVHNIGNAAGNIVLANNLTITNNSGVTQQFQRGITGSGYGIIKEGTGTIQFSVSSGDNTYSGDTRINAGTILASSPSVYSADSKIILNGSSAVMRISSTGTQTFSGAIEVTENGGTVSKGNTGTLNYNGTFASTGTGDRTLRLESNGSGAGTFTSSLVDPSSGKLAINKTGGNTFIIAGDNSYTGGTTVSAGTLTMSHANALGSTNGSLAVNGATTILNIANLNLNVGNLSGDDAGSTIQGSAAGTRTFTIGNGNADGGHYLGIIANGTGTTNLAKTGNGAIRLSGGNSYTGTTTISEGVLIIGNGGTIGTLGGNSNTSIASGAELRIDRSTASTGYAYSGTLSGNGTVNIPSDRRFNFLTQQTNSDNLSFNVNGILGLDTSAGATLSHLGELTGSGTIQRRGGGTVASTIVIGGKNTDSIYSGIITTAEFSIRKEGNGSLTLSSSTSSFGGTTTIQAGKLIAGANAPSGSAGAFGNTTSSIVLGNTSTGASDAPSLFINGAFTVGRNISVGSTGAAYNATIGGSNTSGTSIYSGTITFNAASNYTATLQAATNGTVDFQGAISTNNKAIAIGSSGNTGTVLLTNTLSTTAGVNVNFGTLLLNTSDRLGNTTPVTVAGGILDTGTGLTDTVSAFNMSSGSLNGTGAPPAATYVLTGGTVNAQLGSGAITVNTGTVALGSAGRLNSSSTLSVQGGQLTLAGAENVATYQQTGGTLAGTGHTLTSAAAYDMRAGTVSASLGGGVGLNKTTAGTVILSGNNSYTGATVVSEGTLIINGSSSSTSLTVANGATFGGTGAISGDTTISGLHSPGNSPGIQTFGGDLTYDTGASVLWELVDNTTSGRGTNYDGINVGGALSFDVATPMNLSFTYTGSFVDWAHPFWDNSYTGTSGWLVYSGATSLANFNNLSINVENWLDGQGDAFNTDLNGSSFSLVQNGNDIYLNYAIPEPRAALLGSLGLLVLLRRRR